MDKQINLYFISLSGNTRSFVERLKTYLLFNDIHSDLIDIHKLVKEGQTIELDKPTFVFIPTYLEGGNGIDSGDKEILTTPAREMLVQFDNYKHVLGIIGSGNKNFNEQYCLTAKQYSKQFNVPVIDDFELRGLQNDIERIGNKIIGIVENN